MFSSHVEWAWMSCCKRIYQAEAMSETHCKHAAWSGHGSCARTMLQMILPKATAEGLEVPSTHPGCSGSQRKWIFSGTARTLPQTALHGVAKENTEIDVKDDERKDSVKFKVQKKSLHLRFCHSCSSLTNHGVSERTSPCSQPFTISIGSQRPQYIPAADRPHLSTHHAAFEPWTSLLHPPGLSCVVLNSPHLESSLERSDWQLQILCQWLQLLKVP